MAKKQNHKNENIEEFVSAKPDGEVIEFDETLPEDQSTGVAQVQYDSDDDPSGVEVDEGLFQARDALETQMGGIEAMVSALNEPNDSPSLGLENVIGFGVGEKSVGGRYTGTLAVKVYVTEKVSATSVDESAMIPHSIGGHPTDVEEVGDVMAETFRGRFRPAPGGSSIGHKDITAGTHGCLVVLNNNRLCCLSNNHVLADSNQASIGDPILQPGPVDGGRNPRDRVGILQNFAPIAFGNANNRVDAAVAWTSFRLLAGRHHCYRINTRPRSARLNMLVRKCGRTTQSSLGIVTGVGVTIRVNFGSAGVARFTNQLQIRGVGRQFRAAGDSGALIVSSGTKQPVALLFAGGSGFTFANRIEDVISALGISRFLNLP